MKKSKSDKTFSIVLPFYNEEDVVEEVVRSLILQCQKNGLSVKFVLVNNGSSDKTGEIINRLKNEFEIIKTITIGKNKGYGYGIRRGLSICDSPYIGYMWGDGQIKPIYLVRVAKELTHDSSLDLCKVVRVKRYDGLKRNLVTKIYNSLFSILFLMNERDVNGTPKLFKRSSYEKISLVSNDWFLDAELLIKAKSKKLSIKEIPAIFTPRAGGSSNVSYLTIFEFLFNIFRYRLKSIKS
ncbi:MAG: glycosyltransferase family 2 protein [Patescibacteria group bacterium]